MNSRVSLIVKVIVLTGFVGFSGMLLTSQWLRADEASLATAPISQEVSLDDAQNRLAIGGSENTLFSSGSALAIILVVIALVAVARRDSHKDSST